MSILPRSLLIKKAFLTCFILAFGQFLWAQSAKDPSAHKKEVVNHKLDVSANMGKDVVILVYHRFGNSQYPSTNIDTSLFRQHLTYLKANDYEVLTLGQAVDRQRAGTLEKGHYAVITVDDGYKTFQSGAMPLLKEFGFKATLFVNTESVGGNSYLDWADLKELKAAGIEIGNHSHSHAHFLNKASSNEVKAYFQHDLKKAQKAFQKHLDFKPDLYAYPYGEYNEEMENILEAEGFKAAAAQHSGVFHKGGDLYAIPRFPMASHFAKMKSFKEKVQMDGLRLEQQKPANTIFKQNPPQLKLTFPENSKANLRNIQCFVSGSTTCSIDKNLDAQPPEITFEAKSPLKGRRSKYTITAPSKEGDQWFWFSHLWVQPQINE